MALESEGGKSKSILKELLIPVNPVSKDKFVKYLKISSNSIAALAILGLLLGGLVVLSSLAGGSGAVSPIIIAISLPFLGILIGLSIAGGSVLKGVVHTILKLILNGKSNNIKLKSNGVFLLILIIALSVSRDFLLILAGFGIYGFVRAANRIAKEELNTRVNWWQMIKTSISSTLKNKKTR
jgi:hypothetical protein